MDTTQRDLLLSRIEAIKRNKAEDGVVGVEARMAALATACRGATRLAAGVRPYADADVSPAPWPESTRNYLREWAKQIHGR